MQQKKQASRKEEAKEDPDAIKRMAEKLTRQAGIDKWALMNIDILGAFGDLDPIYLVPDSDSSLQVRRRVTCTQQSTFWIEPNQVLLG